MHSREIIERLLKTGTSNRNAFDWMSQLRVYWVSPSDNDLAELSNLDIYPVVKELLCKTSAMQREFITRNARNCRAISVTYNNQYMFIYV